MTLKIYLNNIKLRSGRECPSRLDYHNNGQVKGHTMEKLNLLLTIIIKILIIISICLFIYTQKIINDNTTEWFNLITNQQFNQNF